MPAPPRLPDILDPRAPVWVRVWDTYAHRLGGRVGRPHVGARRGDGRLLPGAPLPVRPPAVAPWHGAHSPPMSDRLGALDDRESTRPTMPISLATVLVLCPPLTPASRPRDSWSGHRPDRHNKHAGQSTSHNQKPTPVQSPLYTSATVHSANTAVVLPHSPDRRWQSARPSRLISCAAPPRPRHPLSQRFLCPPVVPRWLQTSPSSLPGAPSSLAPSLTPPFVLSLARVLSQCTQNSQDFVMHPRHLQFRVPVFYHGSVSLSSSTAPVTHQDQGS